MLFTFPALNVQWVCVWYSPLSDCFCHHTAHLTANFFVKNFRDFEHSIKQWNEIGCRKDERLLKARGEMQKLWKYCVPAPTDCYTVLHFALKESPDSQSARWNWEPEKISELSRFALKPSPETTCLVLLWEWSMTFLRSNYYAARGFSCYRFACAD